MKVPQTGIIGAVCGDIIGLPYELRADRTKDYNSPLKAALSGESVCMEVHQVTGGLPA